MQNCGVLAQNISFSVREIIKLYFNYLEILFTFVGGDECKIKLTIKPLSEYLGYESESVEADNGIND